MPDFLTGAGGGASALEQILARKKADAQQQFLDQITLQNQKIAMDRNAREDELQRQAAKDLEYNREDQRASRSAEAALPGEVDPLTAELWRKHGYGTMLENKEVPGQLQAQGETPDTRDPNKIITYTQGGSKYQSAREAAKERAAQAEAIAADHAASQKEQFDRDAALRRELQNNTIQGENDRAKAALQARVDAADEKKAETEKENQNRIEGVKNDAAGTLDILNRIIDEKGNLQSGVSGVVGPTNILTRYPDWWLNNVSGGDQMRNIEQLKSRLTLGLIDQMKAASKTGSIGFRLTNQDVQILQNAAANLNRAQSEQQFAETLKSVRETLNKVIQSSTGQPRVDSGGSAGNSAQGDYTYDISGNLIKGK